MAKRDSISPQRIGDFGPLTVRYLGTSKFANVIMKLLSPWRPSVRHAPAPLLSARLRARCCGQGRRRQPHASSTAHRECPLLATSGHSNRANECPLLGAKRTLHDSSLCLCAASSSMRLAFTVVAILLAQQTALPSASPWCCFRLPCQSSFLNRRPSAV